LLRPRQALIAAGILSDLYANKDSFTAKPITQETDTSWKQVKGVGKYLWSAFTPNLIGLPGSYATSNVAGSLTGQTDKFERELSPVQAIAGSLGFKLGSYPEDVLRQNAAASARAQITEIQKNISAIARQYQIHGISEEDARAKIAYQVAKQQQIGQQLQQRVNP
jgi:hypothetical protein